MGSYPPEAYADTGELWWEVKVRPGQRKARLGDEVKIAAWLAFNREVGELFTTEDLREEIRDLDTGGRNLNEHLQRRLRELRDRDGWKIPSNKYAKTVPPGSYRLDAIGWHPGLGTARSLKTVVSKKTRRLVFERDGSRCTICGIGSNEPYPEFPDRLATMTVGHVVPRSHGGKVDIGTLRTECSFCNETLRARTGRPPSLAEVREEVRELTRAELNRLDDWLQQGFRRRDRLDAVYDRIRFMSPDDADAMRREVAESLGR